MVCPQKSWITSLMIKILCFIVKSKTYNIHTLTNLVMIVCVWSSVEHAVCVVAAWSHHVQITRQRLQSFHVLSQHILSFSLVI